MNEPNDHSDARSAAPDDRDPVEVLADEFVQRHRRGEHPTVEEYAHSYPDMADQIRELFPTVAALERLRVPAVRGPDGKAELGGSRPESLGDFRIQREIGRGGMGIVYEAEQISLGRRVAVKVLPRQVLFDSKQLKRFEREARAAAGLHHTNIVPVFGVGEHDGYHFIVMQRIDGVGLDEVLDVLKRLARGAAPQGTDEVIAADRASQSLQIAQALAEGSYFAPSGFEGKDSHGKAGGGSGSSRETLAAAASDTADGLARPPASITPASGADASGAQGGADRPVNTFPAAAASVATGKKIAFGPMYWRNVARIGLQVADALSYAHSHGMLHRDIKPANLLLDLHGVVWVADFGLAKAQGLEDVSRSGDIVGTLRYMAPEQAQGAADARSDLFSLGLSLYEMLALEPAFDDSTRRRALVMRDNLVEATPLRRIRGEIPRDLETIVMKTIATEPARRYRSAGQMAADLEAFLEDRPIQARRINPAERLWRWGRRNPVTAASLATAAALLIVVLVVTANAYVQTSALFLKAQEALDREIQERDKAEKTLSIALDALDRLYDRFAPERLAPSAQVTIEDTEGQALSIPVQPALSQDTAAMLEEMLDFYDRLAALNYDNVDSIQRAAAANRRVGDIYQRLGDFGEAEASYKQALDRYEGLRSRVEDPTPIDLSIARLHNELGEVNLLLGNENGGETQLMAAMEILNKLIQHDDPPPDARFELARAYYILGRRPPAEFTPPLPGSQGLRGGRNRGGLGGGGRPGGLFDAGDRRGRRGRGRRNPPQWNDSSVEVSASASPTYINEAIRILEALSAEHPGAPEYRRLLALCYLDRAEGFGSDDWTKAKEILEALTREFPAVPDYKFDLSRAYVTNVIGESFRVGGFASIEEFQTAQARLREAIKLTDELVHQHPNEPMYVSAQALRYLTLGQLLQDEAGFHLLVTGNPPPAADPQIDQYAVSDALYLEAEKSFEEAIRLRQSLVDRFPDSPSHQADLALAKIYLASLYWTRGDIDNADKLLLAIVQEGGALLQNRPDLQLARLLIARGEDMRIPILERLNRPDEAEQARQLRDAQWPYLREPGRGGRGPGRGGGFGGRGGGRSGGGQRGGRGRSGRGQGSGGPAGGFGGPPPFVPAPADGGNGQ